MQILWFSIEMFKNERQWPPPYDYFHSVWSILNSVVFCTVVWLVVVVDPPYRWNFPAIQFYRSRLSCPYDNYYNYSIVLFNIVSLIIVWPVVCSNRMVTESRLVTSVSYSSNRDDSTSQFTGHSAVFLSKYLIDIRFTYHLRPHVDLLHVCHWRAERIVFLSRVSTWLFWFLFFTDPYGLQRIYYIIGNHFQSGL